MSGDLPKPSFAKVAASVSIKNHTATLPKQLPSTLKENSTDMSTPPLLAPGPVIASSRPNMPNPGTVPTAHGHTAVVDNTVASSIDALTIQAKAHASLNDTSSALSVDRSNPMTTRESGSDDSQRADSSSELGTKPPSLDGKSITSGTTFALDEKESLRPDDSASVQAAGEDDDAFSIRGSLIAGSRYGSDLAARARGIQLGDMPERRLLHPTPGSTGQGILTPQSVSSEQQSGADSGVPPLQTAEGSADALNLIYQHAPDDKLIEAMSSSKDRFFLLKLEKEVIDFVQNSKEPYMDLPPSNSFCRMLTHKLADYYHMTHSFEPVIGAVRIFRTPFCRVPTSLAHLDAMPESENSSTPPPAILPKRIMRRGQSDDAGVESTGISMPASEVGSESKDSKDKQQGNQKLTREEREEMYKLARERIFGSSEESTTAEDGDTGVSRASSVSNSRSNAGKRVKGGRQRRDDSDSFDSRNHYTPYWGPQQQTWVQQYPPTQPGQMPAQPPATYPAQMPPVYGQQNIGYSSMPPMMPNQSYPTYQVSQYPPPAQPAQQRYPPGGSPMDPYGSPIPIAGGAQQQAWQPNYNAPAQPAYPPRGPTGTQSQSGIPYAFGQLPANANPHDPKSQHPIPGSYNRNHAFNPKTQSFVPGGNGVHPVPAPQPPFTAPASHHGSPQIGSPHLAFPQYQHAMSQPYGGAYGMVRQASNNSVPGYHTSQPISAPYGQHPPPLAHNPHHTPIQHPIQHLAPNQPPNIPSRPNVPQQGPSHQIFSHLPTYGNPATLPQKPATGI